MAKGLKATVAAVSLGMGLLGAAGAARANGHFPSGDPCVQPSGSSPKSGGAPSPEVNTLLGFLIVGGTVAFLKRKRKGGGAEDAAAA